MRKLVLHPRACFPVLKHAATIIFHGLLYIGFFQHLLNRRSCGRERGQDNKPTGDELSDSARE